MRGLSAQPQDVRMGMTFTTDSKTVQTGTMNLVNLVPENIRSGVVIAGVLGTYDPTPPTFNNNRTLSKYESSWVVPGGVNKIGVIIVGGGGGGNSNYPGPYPDYPDCYRSSKGKGGPGGIVTKILSVVPGETIYYKIGRGGEEDGRGSASVFKGISAEGGGKGPVYGTGASGGTSIEPYFLTLNVVKNIIGTSGMGGSNNHPCGPNDVQQFCSYSGADNGNDGTIIVYF